MSMKNLKFFIGLLIIGSLVVVVTMVFRTMAPQGEKTPPVPESSISADLKLDWVHYTETHEGVKEWEVEAVSAVYYKENSAVLLEKVKATFFGKNQETYVLIAEKGRFDTQTKTIEGFDGVRLDSSDGYQLRTRTLKYLSATKEIRTEDPISMNGPHVQVEGIGLVVEIDRQRMRVMKQVQTTLDLSGLEKIHRPRM
jgi:LPS export ABC transporter protein LptC